LKETPMNLACAMRELSKTEHIRLIYKQMTALDQHLIFPLYH